ncbi:MAG: UvrD-helicase domain-containing protein [Nitrospirae bacterium]|nr:UvrD-helicase domain-containing protein [Nitrospirota bacterium]
MSIILEKDTDIHFPHFLILKASAGSGKTHTLTKRFVQFLLSEKIPRNKLKNILAVTFSNNAAKEMKERILRWLKELYFNKTDAVEELSSVISMDTKSLSVRAGHLIDEILENYSDFQVKTIDSFMTTIFKASAIDFGYNPDFEILMNKDKVMEYAFELFMREVKEGSVRAEFLDRITNLIQTSRKVYLWDPSSDLLEEIGGIYGKLLSSGKQPKINECENEMNILKTEITKIIETIEDEIVKSGIEINKGSSYYKSDFPSLIRQHRFHDLIEKGAKTLPVNKPKKATDPLRKNYDRIKSLWETGYGELIKTYIATHVCSFYTPYLKVYDVFSKTVEDTKRRQDRIFIEDINSKLVKYLDSYIIPDVYFRLGETIFHFLIDEFQDTSPVQWKNLMPLIENTLSLNGSVFIVGDTKQAIYGFRNADYTIMRDCESRNPFPSARHIVQELDINFRSSEKVLEFNEKVFKKIVKESPDFNIPAAKSGLTDYIQKVKEEKRGKGYAEVSILELNEEAPIEKVKIQEIIKELKERGYKYRDIAILAQKNEYVVNATAWLNEKNIPFISFSSLDIRRRKITGELISLLNFLDSPTDDLAFASFILGDIFTGTLNKYHPEINRERLENFLFLARNESPLYKIFQKEFEGLWEEYFSGLFRSTGYFPLYDLVSQIFNVFKVFETLEREEATLVKILETVKDFEGQGYNSLGDFLVFADDEGRSAPEWDINVPKDMDAVQVMTIHKSKGLGFPVVIVLLYRQDTGSDNCIIDNIDENSVRFLRINRKTQESDPYFAGLKNKEDEKVKVDLLNNLYVAFTRAEKELFVVGVKKKKENEKDTEKDIYPLDLLPAGDYAPSSKPEKEKPETTDIPLNIPLSHHHKQIEFKEGATDFINIADKQRGEFIHRVLSFIKYADDGSEDKLLSIIRMVNKEEGTAYPEEEIKRDIMGLLELKDLRRYFKPEPNSEIRNEQEFVDGTGGLFRIDRLIIDRDRVTIIDYKTGSHKDREEKYVNQIRKYMGIAAGIYPTKEIEGILVYTGLKEMRIIR